MQDPEHYIAELGLTFPCPVRPDLDAVIDVEHRAFVNHEVYFFSSQEAAAEFYRRPLRYAGLVTDPVTGSRFAPSEISPFSRYDERPYYFQDRDTAEQFAADPERYARPTRRM